MLICKEATELCSQEMERPLGLGERVSLTMHLMMCSNCTNFRKQISDLRRVAQTYAEGGAVTSPKPTDGMQG